MGAPVWCVYQHTNKQNGKAYVGITCQSPRKRWNGGKGYFQNKKFAEAIKEYGWDNFSHVIIADGLSKDDALSLEKKMIANLSLVENGYNNCVCGGSGAKLSLNDTAQKIRSGLRRARESAPWLYEWSELFDAAESAGVGSNLCDNLNIHCENITKIMEQGGNPPGFDDYLWLSFFINILCKNAKEIDAIPGGSNYAESKSCAIRAEKRAAD